MWIRSLILMFAVGCVGASPAADPPAAAVAEASQIPFLCLNNTAIHVVVCDGSIALFPITVTIDHLDILSDNHLSILSGDLNDLTIVDGNTVDENQLLDDVEAGVLDDFLAKFQVTVTRNEILVCAGTAGSQRCQ